MEEFFELIAKFGYPGVFFISFIASTLIPFSNEIVVAMMPSLGYDIWLIAIWATAGGYLGSLFNYEVGKRGAKFFFSRWVKVKPDRWLQAERIFKRWGNWSLFLVWLPFVGDPLAVVAGAFNIDWRVFSFGVVTGKFVRFIVLLGIINFFT